MNGHFNELLSRLYNTCTSTYTRNKCMGYSHRFAHKYYFLGKKLCTMHTFRSKQVVNNHPLHPGGVNNYNGNYDNQAKVRESSGLSSIRHKCSMVVIYTSYTKFRGVTKWVRKYHFYVICLSFLTHHINSARLFLNNVRL